MSVDGEGHMEAHEAASASDPLRETLRRALAFLASRSFRLHDAQLIFRVRARCSHGAAGAFELGDFASAQGATGHVRFEQGTRVDFELAAQK